MKGVFAMKIGTAQAERGAVAQGYLHTAWLADGAEVRVPVMIAHGKRDGPLLWINAGVHGEEISGIFAIHRLFSRLDVAALRGTVVATPGCNPLALRGCNKFTPEDQLDLDQQFPGRENGWLSEQMAYHFFKELRAARPDYLIDLHALGGVDAVPYTVYKAAAGVDPQINEDAKNMALLMGAEFNCRVELSSAKGELPGSLLGALDVQCTLNGIPAVMVEMGAGNRVHWENVTRVTDGILSVMRLFNMLDGEPKRFHGQKIVTKRDFPCSRRGGLAIPCCKPGEIVKAGTVFARIVDFMGNELERMVAPQDLCLIGVLENPMVHSGKVVAAVGLEWEEVN